MYSGDVKRKKMLSGVQKTVEQKSKMRTVDRDMSSECNEWESIENEIYGIYEPWLLLQLEFDAIVSYNIHRY